MRPLICLVTSRPRLAARLKVPLERAGPHLLAQIRSAARAGVDLVQIREPDLPAGALARLVLHARGAVAGTHARVLVNDRVDVALAVGADGVHLKASSIAPARVRELAPRGWTVGASVHGPADVAAMAAGADFLVAGTVRPSRSKPEGWPTLGVDGLARVVAAAGPVPVLGIGGLSAADAAALRAAGARGLAGIGAFLPAGPERADESVHDAVLRLRIAFDSPEGVP